MTESTRKLIAIARLAPAYHGARWQNDNLASPTNSRSRRYGNRQISTISPKTQAWQPRVVNLQLPVWHFAPPWTTAVPPWLRYVCSSVNTIWCSVLVNSFALMRQVYIHGDELAHIPRYNPSVYIFLSKHDVFALRLHISLNRYRRFCSIYEYITRIRLQDSTYSLLFLSLFDIWIFFGSFFCQYRDLSEVARTIS
jgi:hypothetical protein